MTKISSIRTFHCLALCLVLSACAGTEAIVATPKVDLVSVELERVSISQQTFLLGFDVSNPNAFPLPVKSVRYRVMFDDERFTGGETVAAFNIPARGSDRFFISVDLDILNSVTQISSLLRGGVPEHVSYRVDGSLTVDIPFAQPLGFASSGVIQVQN